MNRQLPDEQKERLFSDILPNFIEDIEEADKVSDIKTRHDILLNSQNRKRFTELLLSSGNGWVSMADMHIIANLLWELRLENMVLRAQIIKASE